LRRASRRWTLLATAAASVVAGGALGGPALGASTGVPECSSAQLRLAFVDKQAATGHRFIDYAFNNIGTVKCALRGYPATVLLSKYGAVIPSTRAMVAQWPLSPVRTAQIAPGQSAYFTFHWSPAGFCPGRVFTFYGLRVVPPHDATGFLWHLGKTQACDSSAMVTAVRPELFPF
jgi:hypothetical protein